MHSAVSTKEGKIIELYLLNLTLFLTRPDKLREEKDILSLQVKMNVAGKILKKNPQPY